MIQNLNHEELYNVSVIKKLKVVECHQNFFFRIQIKVRIRPLQI